MLKAGALLEKKENACRRAAGASCSAFKGARLQAAAHAAGGGWRGWTHAGWGEGWAAGWRKNVCMAEKKQGSRGEYLGQRSQWEYHESSRGRKRRRAEAAAGRLIGTAPLWRGKLGLGFCKKVAGSTAVLGHGNVTRAAINQRQRKRNEMGAVAVERDKQSHGLGGWE